MTTTTRKRVGWLLALGAVPLFVAQVTFAADERSCNMRDAALPTEQITYVLCEQGLLLVTKDDGATWTQRKIPISNSVLRAVERKASTEPVDATTVLQAHSPKN